METFAEVRDFICQQYELFHDEPFVVGFEHKLEDGRRQNVFLAEIKGNDGRRYLRVETTVVPLSELGAEKALRINQILRIGYLAVGDLDSTPYIKMCENIAYRTLEMDELLFIIHRLAGQADRFENVIAQGDDLS